MHGRAWSSLLLASVGLSAFGSVAVAQDAEPVVEPSSDPVVDDPLGDDMPEEAASDDSLPALNPAPPPPPKTSAPRRIPLPIEPNEFIDETGAVADGVFAPHIVQLIEIPLKMQPVDLTQKSDPLWIKGPRPEKNLLATVELAPEKQVTVNLSDGETVVLSRAERNRKFGLSPEAPETLASKSEIYCGEIASESLTSKLVCLHDTDDNGDFDLAAVGLSETIDKHPFATSAMLPSAKLKTALPYQPVAAEALQVMEFEIRNCGKDWDRPFFAMGRKAKASGVMAKDIPLELLLKPIDPDNMSAAELEQIVRILGGGRTGFRGACRKGQQIERFEEISEAGLDKGSILVRLGDLIFSVGSKKKKAPVQLLAAATNRKFRLEKGAVLDSHSGLSAFQKPIATAQRFDKPTFMANGAFETADAAVGVGDTAYSVGFEYGYRGMLTDKSSIRRLFGSRSLEEGTEVYGIPMESRRVTTYGGYSPAYAGMGQLQGNPRDINTRLAWCAPQRKERERVTPTKKMVTDVTWTATCISMVGDRHTITKDIEPAYGVTRLSHPVGVSTSEGNPPVENLGPGSFSKATEIRLIVEKETKAGLKLKRQIWLGDELTSEQPHFLRKSAAGKYLADHGAVKVAFVPTADSTEEDPQFEVEVVQAPEAGDAFSFNNSRINFSFE